MVGCMVWVHGEGGWVHGAVGEERQKKQKLWLCQRDCLKTSLKSTLSILLERSSIVVCPFTFLATPACSFSLIPALHANAATLRGRGSVRCDADVIVSRINGQTEAHETHIELDVNVELYPIEEAGERHKFLLASTLNPDGTPDSGVYEPYRSEGIMADYDYVMYGKVFKYTEEKPSMKVYARFMAVCVCACVCACAR
jgi:hypothetical protein